MTTTIIPNPDKTIDTAPAINAPLLDKGRVELAKGIHWTYAPVGINSTVDLSSALDLSGENIRATKIMSNARHPDTNDQGQHPILQFTTTKGNLRYLHLSDMALHHGSSNIYTRKLLYSRFSRIQVMQAWKWGIELQESSVFMEGMSFVHNVYGNSLWVRGGSEDFGSHLVNSMIGEDSGAVYVTDGGRLRVSGCEIFKMRDNLNPIGPYAGYGNPAFFVGAGSTLTVDGCHMLYPKDVCENIFLLDKTRALNVVNNPIITVDNRVLLRARFLHVGAYPYGPITVTGNTIYFGPQGQIHKYNVPTHAMRNSVFSDNVLMVPAGHRANFEAQLQGLRNIWQVSDRYGNLTSPNIVEGNRIYEYDWTPPPVDDTPDPIG